MRINLMNGNYAYIGTVLVVALFILFSIILMTHDTQNEICGYLAHAFISNHNTAFAENHQRTVESDYSPSLEEWHDRFDHNWRLATQEEVESEYQSFLDAGGYDKFGGNEEVLGRYDSIWWAHDILPSSGGLERRSISQAGLLQDQEVYARAVDYRMAA